MGDLTSPFPHVQYPKLALGHNPSGEWALAPVWAASKASIGHLLTSHMRRISNSNHANQECVSTRIMMKTNHVLNAAISTKEEYVHVRTG
jgi:hypothetical protein